MLQHVCSERFSVMNQKYLFFLRVSIVCSLLFFVLPQSAQAAINDAKVFTLNAPSNEQLNIYLGDRDKNNVTSDIVLSVGVKLSNNVIDSDTYAMSTWKCTNCDTYDAIVLNSHGSTVDPSIDLHFSPEAMFTAGVNYATQHGGYKEGQSVFFPISFQALAEAKGSNAGEDYWTNFIIKIIIYPGEKGSTTGSAPAENDTRPDACLCTFSYADDSNACTTASERKPKQEAYVIGKALSDYLNEETFLYDEYEDEISGYIAPIPTAANCASYVATVKAGGEAKGTPGDAICTESPISCQVIKCNLDGWGRPIPTGCGTLAQSSTGDQSLGIDAKPKETQLFFDKSDYKAPEDYAGPLPRCAFDGSCRDVNKLLELVIRSAQFVFGLIGSVALVMFVYGGFLMITAFGSAEKFKKGTGVLVAAVVGLFIAFGAYLLIDFVLDALNVSSVFRAIGS